MEMYFNIKKIGTVNFEQFNVALINKSIHF